MYEANVFYKREFFHFFQFLWDLKNVFKNLKFFHDIKNIVLNLGKFS